MMLFAVVSWWYTNGWLGLARRVMERTDHVLELFSVGLLAKTLFAPFKQIDAGMVRGSFDVQLRAFGNRLFSRVFGAVLRSLVIVVGLLSALVVGVLGVVQLVVWPLVPAFPLFGIILALAGWRL